MRRSKGLVAVLLSCLGCEGVVVSPGPGPGVGVEDPPGGPVVTPTTPPPGPGEAVPPLFSCDPAAVPESLPLPRLSRTQLQATLQLAISLALPAEAAAIWSSVSATVARYPVDLRVPSPGDLKGGYERTDQAIHQTQIDAVYDAALAIAQQLTSSSARMTALLGACATDSSTTNDRACLEAFIARWGSRVLRYPLPAADVTWYADIAGTTPVAPAAVADVVATMLQAPQTLYQVEHGTDDAAAVAPLSAYELASRLSFHFWQTPPDDALWAAAQSGALLDPAGYQAQVTRLVSSPKLRASLDELVAQWLRLDELAPLDALNADPVFKGFAGTPLPAAGSRAAMIDDVLASAAATVAAGGTVSDFLTDKRSYAKDGYLAGIYGVAPWSGSGEAPLVTSAKRAGLLTRPALLSTGTATTRPIHKGYLVRNAVLCQQIGAPPPNVNATPPTPTDGVTTRQAVTNLTSAGSCSGCHTTRINPPGFITEGFDALGRERSFEPLFDAQGNVTAQLPVDTTTTPELWPGDTRVMSDASALTAAIDETKLFHSCFARHYFRFTARRTESPAKDGCMLSALETAARSGAPLGSVLETAAQASAFKTRSFP